MATLHKVTERCEYTRRTSKIPDVYPNICTGETFIFAFISHILSQAEDT